MMLNDKMRQVLPYNSGQRQAFEHILHLYRVKGQTELQPDRMHKLKPFWRD